MEVTLTIPDKVAEEIQNSSSITLPRRLLELVVIQAHEDELITEMHSIRAISEYII